MTPNAKTMAETVRDRASAFLKVAEAGNPERVRMACIRLRNAMDELEAPLSVVMDEAFARECATYDAGRAEAF